MPGRMTVDLAAARTRKSGLTAEERDRAAGYHMAPEALHEGAVDALFTYHPPASANADGYLQSRKTFADEHGGTLQSFEMAGDVTGVVQYLQQHQLTRRYPFISIGDQSVAVLGVQAAYLKAAFERDLDLGLYCNALNSALGRLTA